jgi:hypothetical protein
MAKRERRNPELNLVPEEQKVLSTDFNLFYVPQEQPLPAGLKEFTSSLDSFVNGGLQKASLGAEVKMKKSERAKALKEYTENKGKFRDAVKNGEIGKEANPYYLEKYKELTLNSFANEFSERVEKNYNGSGVKKDLTEGAFERFYKEQLGLYIKEKELGFFAPEELEKSFFQETSVYRQQMEARHKQNLLAEFNKNFDSKIKDRIVGTIEKYKNFDTDLLSEGEIQSGITQWDKISEGLQKEIGDLLNTTGDGRGAIDTIFDGLELYITTTDDYEFALKVIQNIPQKLLTGTGTVADIGRLKNKQQELKDLLISKQNEKLNEIVKFDANQDKLATVNTHNFLEQAKKENPDFNISQWTKDKSRTDAERIAGEAYEESLKYSGGTKDDGNIVKRIEEHLENREYKEASDLAYKGFKDGDLRMSTFKSYKTTVIPNAQNLEGNVYFDDLYISGSFDAFDKTISSGKLGGNVTKAITARAFLRKRLLAWLDANADNSIYEGKTGELQKQEDFNAEFDKQIFLMKKTGEYEVLFGKGQTELTGKNSVELLEEKTNKAEEDLKNEPNDLAQKIADWSILKSVPFREKYGITKEQFAKENNL